MKKYRRAVVSVLACLVITLHTGGAAANDSIAVDWRSQYPDACKTLQDATLEANDCVLCHHPGGNNLNPYGSDLAMVGVNFVVVEGFDSDGDERTNGQEILLDCTLPGDVTSVPVKVETWSAIKALFR